MKLKQILNNIKLAFHGVIYGLKDTDDKIFTQSNSIVEAPSTIEKLINNQRVSIDLLNGEVTQEVEDLRYRTYAVSEESRKYHYEGGERAEKTFEIVIETPKRFSMGNKAECLNITDSLENKEETHTLKILYKSCPRFRIENFCDWFEVDLENTTIKFHFNQCIDKTTPIKRSFLNYLKSNQVINDYCHNSLESFGRVFEKLSFITYKISGVKDLLKYELLNGDLIRVSSDGKELIMSVRFQDYTMEDIQQKYYSENMASKYKEKAPKENKIVDTWVE